MTTRRTLLIPLSFALVALAMVFGGLPACEVNSPEGILRAPVIKGYFPVSQRLDALVGDTLHFSIRAIDPDSKKLQFYFQLGDSVVSFSDAWAYVVNDTGLVSVRAAVSNGDLQSSVEWVLERRMPANRPPIITSVVPEDPAPTVIVGNAIDFVVNAMDPEGKSISFIFTRNDTVVSASNRYHFQPARVGPVRIKAIVSDGSGFASHLWNVSVLAEPDSVLPAPVRLLSLQKGTNPGELQVQWIAVGDDSMDGFASSYRVRTAPIPIIDEESWSTASERSGSPAPAPPGTVQAMTIRGLKPATFVYVAVRAVDDYGNLSPLANTLSAWTKGNEVRGIVRDAITEAPVPGLQVQLLSVKDTTDVDGRFALTELPDGSGLIDITDENVLYSYGAYFDIRTTSYQVHHGDSLKFWMIPNVQIQSTMYPSYLSFVKQMNRLGSSYTEMVRTWNFPVDVYIPERQNEGLDYKQEIINVCHEWESLTGLTLFNIVDTKPTVGIYFEYDSSLDRDYYLLVGVGNNQLPVLGVVRLRTLFTASNIQLFHTTVAHELGHALGMEHSIDPIHLMVGGRVPAVTHATQDEIWLARTMVLLGRGQLLGWYLFE
jgi:hypothetical protein